MAPSYEQVNLVCKDVLDQIIGNNAYQPNESAKWNEQVVESITKHLVELNRPYKYCITCIVMQPGTGAGLNVSSTCYWDKSCDQSYSIRWESKGLLAVLNIFAINYTRV